MADVRRVVRQWLETDAAFGVSEVPVASRSAASGGTMPAAARPVSEPAPRPVAAAPTRAALPARAPAPAAVPPLRAARAAASEQPSLLGDTGGAGRGREVAKKKAAFVLPPIPAGDIPALPPITRKQKEAGLEALRKEVDACCKPYINDISTKVVFGEGDPDAEIMFVGEGPGTEEDKTGRPFVGRSGQLLDKMIAAMGYKREQVYIGNVVKLRCAEWDEMGTRLTDRPPNPEEVSRGLPLLHKQIEIIRPKVIVTLGAPAVKYLTGTTEGVMKIRGTWLNYRGIPVMPTYHPSFVLRAYTPENRKKVWSDLQAALKKAKES